MGLGQASLIGLFAAIALAQVYVGFRISKLACARFPDIWSGIIADRQILPFHHGTVFIRRYGELAADDPELKRLVRLYRATQPLAAAVFATLVLAIIMR